MPNHCYNELTITGDADKLSEIENNVESLLNYLVPMPTELEDDGWYEWLLENWGTKWDIYDHHVCRVSPRKLYISFNSAWAPPFYAIEDGCERLGLEFDLFYLEDDGMDFIGLFSSKHPPLHFDYEYDNLEAIPKILYDNFESYLLSNLESLKELEAIDDVLHI